MSTESFRSLGPLPPGTPRGPLTAHLAASTRLVSGVAVTATVVVAVVGGEEEEDGVSGDKSGQV